MVVYPSSDPGSTLVSGVSATSDDKKSVTELICDALDCSKYVVELKISVALCCVPSDLGVSETESVTSDGVLIISEVRPPLIGGCTDAIVGFVSSESFKLNVVN